MRGLPSTLVALILISASKAVTVIDFSLYPLGAQDCLYQSSNKSNCATTAVTETNSCLCNNGGNFITNAAKCLGESNPSVLTDAYDKMKGACDFSKTPINVMEDQYLSAAGFTGTMTPPKPTATPKPSSTGSPRPATTTTEPPEPDKDADKEKPPAGGSSNQGLPFGAKIGVIVASTVAGLAMAGAAIYLLLRHKRKKDGEESHPMLPQDNGPLMHTLVPTPDEIAQDRANSPGVMVEKDAPAIWRPTTAPLVHRDSGFNWETPDDLAYTGANPRAQP